MSDFVNKITLVIDGETEENFKAFTPGGRTLRKQVNLMNKTGHVNMTERETFSLDYIKPIGPKRDFSGIEGGLVTIEYEDGSKIKYEGVHTLEIGDETHDGENEIVVPISFGATGREDT